MPSFTNLALGASSVSAISAVTIYLVMIYWFKVDSMICIDAPARPFLEHQANREVSYVFHVDEKLESVETEYQHLVVYRHKFFGHVLVIDGSLQITEKDEANYHEMMAHVPLAYLPNAERALVVGGGDGGAMLRILQHQNIKEVSLVDIDMPTVRDLMSKYFPHLYNAYQDPRVKTFTYDGAQWVKDQLAEEHNLASYDLMIVDSTDYGAAESLFTDQFYRELQKLLKPRGILIMNVDSPSWNTDTVRGMQLHMQKLFNYAFIYHYTQPCFLSGHYGFIFLSQNVHPMESAIDWKAWGAKEIPTDYYTPDVHLASFLLPNSIKRQLSQTVSLQQADWLWDKEGKREAGSEDKQQSG